MLQAAAGFCGGAWLSHKCSTCELPHVRRAADESTSFRLSVRVLSASVPTLSAPGVLVRRRPRAEVALGLVEKESEFAVFSGTSAASSRDAGALGSSARGSSGSTAVATALGAASCGTAGTSCCGRDGDGCGSKCRGAAPGSSPLAPDVGPPPPPDVDCPWRFGDTLTFTARLADLLGPGLRLRLRGHCDVRLGPLQLDLPSTSAMELGEAVLSLRKRVLPACVNVRHCDPDGTVLAVGADGSFRIWESPVLVIPLAHVKTEPDSDTVVTGNVASYLAITFGVSVDPEQLLRAADDAQRPLVERVVEPLKNLVPEPSVAWFASVGQEPQGEADGRNHYSALLSEHTKESFTAPLPGPPGSVQASNAAAARYATAMAAGARPPSPPRPPTAPSAARPPVISDPELAPDGWVCHSAPTGRVFWHHTSLGPAPWEQFAAGDCEECPPSAEPLSRSQSPPQQRETTRSRRPSGLGGNPAGQHARSPGLSDRGSPTEMATDACVGAGGGSVGSPPPRKPPPIVDEDAGSFHERFRIKPYSLV